MASADPLFQWPWPARVGFKQLAAMIRFNHDNVAATEMFAHVLRCVTKIGDERERLGRGEEITIVATGESKTNRFLRVVRHGEALDFEITETKTRAGFEHLPIGAMSESRLNGASGGCVGEDPNVWIFFQSIDATCVIAVLVGEEYGVDSIETFADGFEQGRKFTRRKTDVDEYAKAYSAPGAMRAGFELYRAFDRDASDNRAALATDGKLDVPVLAIGGEISTTGPLMEEMLREVAGNVTGRVIPGTAHWVPEEAPAAFVDAVVTFTMRGD